MNVRVLVSNYDEGKHIDFGIVDVSKPCYNYFFIFAVCVFYNTRRSGRAFKCKHYVHRFFDVRKTRFRFGIIKSNDKVGFGGKCDALFYYGIIR